ncbi:MAG: tocopherol cyclase family protein [Candidatus Freyarchaeum deiterrae]
MSLYGLRVIWKPEMYHGHSKKRNFFEGWYFKIIDSKEEFFYAIIPGVSLGSSKEVSHSFIQVLNGVEGTSSYHTYSLGDFSYSKNNFEIWIGKNYFSLNGIKLNIEGSEARIKGELKFKNLIGWPVKFTSPGAMGWYAFLPFLETYHGILSLNHDIDGNITFNDQKVNFSGGKGYIEKDWGSSFPSAYIWMQSNHFDEKNASITASIARVPLLGRSSTGFIVGFLYNNKLYKFTANTGAKIIKLQKKANLITASFRDKMHLLEIEAAKEKGAELASPILGEMAGRINETLKAKINVTLYRLNGGKKELVFSGVGRNSGLEVVGNFKELVSGFKTVKHTNA